MVAPRRPTTAPCATLPDASQLLPWLLEVQTELNLLVQDGELLTQRLVERTMGLLEAPGAMLAEVRGEEVVCRAASGSVARAVGERMAAGSSLAGVAARERTVLRCDDSELDARVDRGTCRRLGVRSFVVAPLTHGERLLGLLFVLSPRPGSFEPRVEDVLRLMALGWGTVLAHAEEARERREREREVMALHEALRRRQAELDALLECVPEPVLLQGERGPRANGRALALLGVESDAQLGGAAAWRVERLRPRAAHTWAPLEPEQEPLALALGGTPTVRELWVHHGGEAVDVQVRAHALPVRLEGQVLGAVAVLVDVTGLRRLEEQRDQFMSLVEQSSDVIGVSSLSGRPLYLNAAGRELLGFESLEAFRAVPLLRSYAEEDHALARAAFQEVRERGGSWEGELRLRHQGSGQAVPVLLHAFVLVDRETGRPVALASVARELTAQKRADAVRDRLLDVVGNDLRAPLSSIVVAASTLLRRGTLGEGDARAAARIAQGAEKLNRMIGQVLDFTRTRLGAGLMLLRTRVDLDALAQDAVAEAELTDPERLVRYVRLGDARGMWDRERLKEVLGQLLDNAMRHGDPQWPVDVQVRGEGEQVVLEVRNLGAPIAPERMASLFEPFRQSSDPEGRGEHLGMGLYIAREIVVAHGGALEVRSSEAEGTTFRVRLPRGLAGR